MIGENDPGSLRLEDLYRPPADEETSASPPEAAAPSTFYVVSPLKFLLLALLSGAPYELYWFFTNWRRYGDATGKSTLPLLRALFPVFFVHRLYSLLAPGGNGAPARRWPQREMATLFVLCEVCSRLVLPYLVPYVAQWLGASEPSWLGHAATVLGMCTVYPQYVAQRAANAAAGDPEGTRNARLTPVNYFFLLLGIVGWLLYFKVIG